MKATHTARLKNIQDLIGSINAPTISLDYLNFLSNNEGGLISVFSVLSDGHQQWQNDNFGFNKNMITNITEIKPEIEIPETPFWFKDSIGDVYSVSVNKDPLWDYVLYKNNKHHKGVDSLNIKSMLNNGTWTICDEPEKEEIKIKPSEWDALRISLQEMSQTIKYISDKFNLGVK